MSFDFQTFLHPKERLHTIPGEHGEITFKLVPFQTAQAFECDRWLNLVKSDAILDAEEFMFQMGLNRIAGWDNMVDAEGKPVECTLQMLNCFSRIPSAIPYIKAIGQLTLEEAGLLKDLEKKSEADAPEAVEGSPTSNETSDSSTPTS
jgi:hypothetical protein